jgi:predicted dehydrogenase
VTTRRSFLSSSLAAGFASPLFAKRGLQGSTGKSANDKIQIALIGCGGMGQGDAKSSTATGLTRLVAAADCYTGRLEHMKETYGKDILVTRDYQEILARPDIDAVLIGTPDHWHRQVTIDSLKARKDVYCEKPMVQHIDDGAPVIAAQNDSKQILQIGSQRVSSVIYKKAQELYQSGAIGKLNMVEAWWDRNSAVGAWEYTIPPDADTQTCDWPRFEGRAQKTEWDPKRFFRWRCYRDYGTGVAGDLFVHLFSGLHFITGAQGPTRVYATGGLRFWKDGRDVPDVLIGLYDYPESASHPAFNLILRVNFVSGAEETEGFRFIGSDGIMTVGSNVTLTKPPKSSTPGYSIGTFSEPEQAAFLKQYHEKYPEVRVTPNGMPNYEEQVFEAPLHYSDHFDHHLNFALAVRARQPVVEDATFGFRAAGPALLSNISYFEKRVVEWDPQAMRMGA